MAELANAKENPDSFAERLHKMLLEKRAERFALFSGDPAEIEELKAHINYVEPIPELDEIRSLLETAFYASIAREEGADVTFSLIWTNPRMAEESDWPRLQFDEGVGLQVEALRKLSPASDPELVDIALYSGENGPSIWGLVFLREKELGRRGFPPGLTVIVDSPGVLTIKSGSELVATYSRGLGVLVSEGTQIDKVGLVQLLAKIFSDDRDGREKIFAASKVLNFANEALIAGQGATLLITMGSEAPIGVSFPRYKAEVVSREQLSVRLADNKFLYLSKSISRIALVDGAVVMSEFGVIFGFGGMIKVADAKDFEILLVDSRNFAGKGTAIRLSEFSGGSRHRSALSFCYENPGAAALVVSHDGVMSVMTRPLQEDRVIVVRPFYKTFDLGM
jgi:hypothetical protein